ncbi:hypothetical protein GJ744_001849 [Endocarpon pusillum]|uniref:Uncharacterized protein n=1 Tax=Endocarpon pusillum TaxID=364733 RepID=A0A8H7ASB9_9EURO|nr:hypothetical protein GJ744_001849 [Endocarpon pusillum]
MLLTAATLVLQQQPEVEKNLHVLSLYLLSGKLSFHPNWERLRVIYIYYPNQKEVREQLIKTRREFVKLQGIHYRQYEGCAFTYINGGRVKFHIRGRIMVDAKAFREMNPNQSQPKLTSFADGFDLTDWGDIDAEKTEKVIGDGLDPSSLSDQVLLRCSATVRGFWFREKSWLEFGVTGIHEID